VNTSTIYAGTFIITLLMKLHIHNCSGLLVIATHCKAKYRVIATAILFLSFLRKKLNFSKNWNVLRGFNGQNFRDCHEMLIMTLRIEMFAQSPYCY